MLKERVKFFRSQKNLSQQELAVLADLRQPQVSKIERGSRRVTAEELQKIAVALNVPVAALLGENQPKAVGE